MQPNQICHIYNRGNNRQKIFYCDDNYKYFRAKIEKHLKPHLHIIAYCLMPNHFHILAYLKNDFKRANFSKGLAICLRSYTRAMNKRYNRTGSLFQQHTKIKNISVSADPDYYNFICFNYIHQNPLKAGLVQELADWPYSSYREYSASLADSFSSCSIGRNLLDLPFDTSAFIKLTNQVIDTDYLPLKTD